jgi:pyruvate,water dikinase
MAKKESIVSSDKANKNILWFKEIAISDIPLVGGKTASLGEMYTKLSDKGISVPNGFAISAGAYREFLAISGLDKKIKATLHGLDTSDVRALATAGAKVRSLVLSARLPKVLEHEISKAYRELSASEKKKNISVAVRSSATAEDLPDASFAGQQETYLNVRGEKELFLAVKKCISSLFTDRAISYRETKGFDHMNVALSVCVQVMVRSDIGASGVMFTLDTESGFQGVVLINAAYGLGEYVVKGRVTPDQYYVFKDGVKQGKKALFSKILGTKDAKLVYAEKGGTTQKTVPQKERNMFVLKTEEVVQLAKWGTLIESHYQKPQDIEWAKDGETGKLYIVQARPVTVKAHINHSIIETYILKQTGTVLLSGTAVGQKIGAGKVRVIERPKDMHQFKKGEVLVTRITDPDWEPIMRMASAIVTEEGGKTSHAAIVSRELGVPCLVGVRNARKLLSTGKPVTVSCAEGDEGHIYKNILPFEVKKTEIKSVPPTKTKIMMNVGDPDNAFPLSFIPNDGVGLAREEFIFTNFIRIHPLALLHFSSLKDKQAKKKIAEITRGYKNKADYCIDKLAEGVARIAVAFYPNPVIIRFSDFKTNEYATLIGGSEFEPKEENPMLGWRGASRYYSKEYKEGFRMECEAMKKVRNDWGLTNVITMIPFCRTPHEGEQVIKTMEEFGLKRGENGLQVYVMCEIPSNVILAEEFAKIFDGFSIGSNDLTQLTLGVDRDSAQVAHVYDERNGAVTKLIRDVISVAHKYNKKVGICGQAPSDHPEFAEFLVKAGIDSISLNPDTVIATRERIAVVEKTLGKSGKKTNPAYIGLIAAIAFLAGSLMLVGAGCADQSLQSQIRTEANEVSPGVLRTAFEKAREAREANQFSTLTESSFTDFTIKYPRQMSVEHMETGLVLKDKDSNSSIHIFLPTKAPVFPGESTEITLGGKSAKQYVGTSPDGRPMIVITTVLKNGKTFEIDSTFSELKPIIESLTFGTPNEISDKDSTDIFCAQVITYAKDKGSSECKAFPTPCAVPDGWRSCTP